MGILKIIKRLIFSVLFIYMYNKLTLPFNFIIPINFFTVFLITLFGIPSIIGMVLFNLIIL